MSSVYVGICQNNDLVITEFADVKIFPDTTAKRSDHGLDFVIHEYFFQWGFFHIQDLAPQWQHRLGSPVSGSLHCTAG